MTNHALSVPVHRSSKRVIQIALVALSLAFCGRSVAQQETVPFEIKVDTTYLCQPPQGHPYRIKVSEVHGMWIKGEITSYDGLNVKVLPDRGTGWINLRSVFFILEEKR